MSNRNSVIVTLFEGDYVLGLGALINSLYGKGFRGRVYVGYRGELSGWSREATPKYGCSSLAPTSDLEVRFLPVPDGWHMANLKPHFMLDVWQNWEPDAEILFYFDPDIVTKCDFDFFEDWADCGVAMVQEIVMQILPPDHPLQVRWKRWAESHGFGPLIRPLTGNLNSGFLGVTAKNRPFLELWKALIECVGKELPMTGLCQGNRWDVINFTDQDPMAIATMFYPGEVSRMGPDGMDFLPGGYTMSHATGGAKPWRKRFIRSALGGVPPNQADKGWVQNLETPIQVLPPRVVASKRRAINVAAAIGRFIRRA